MIDVDDDVLTVHATTAPSTRLLAEPFRSVPFQCSNPNGSNPRFQIRSAYLM